MTLARRGLGRPPLPLSAKQAWARLRPAGGDGRMAALARLVGTTQANLNFWKQVPEQHVDTVAAFLGVTRSDVRPDLYPPPDPWIELDTLPDSGDRKVEP